MCVCIIVCMEGSDKKENGERMRWRESESGDTDVKSKG